MKKRQKILSPHDKLFKKSLENPEAAEHFIKRYLPADILQLVQLNTLEVEHITFIDEDFKSSASDVIFRVNILSGEKAYLYFLLEHQRKAEKFMPFRLLKYTVRLMDLHRTKYKAENLPLVVPFVIYNGESRYPYSLDLFDLFDEAVREKARATWVKPSPLLDLSQYNTEEVNDDPWIAALLNALKYAASRKVSPSILVEHLDLHLIKLATGGKLLYIEGIIRYITEVQPLDVRDELWDELQERLQPVLGEDYMISIADGWLQEGMHLKEVQIARNLLGNGLGVDFVAQNTGLDIELLKKLQEEIKH